MTNRSDDRPEQDSVERAIDQIGDRWTFLILRDAFFGQRRFDDIQKSTGASPNILSDRLKKLVGFGILEKRAYQDRPQRHEYRLTEKGRDLYPAIVLLMRWGDRWTGECDRPPLTLVHKTCGKASAPVLVCDECGEAIHVHDMDWEAARY
ncbi:MAG: transcriptional regulator [Alphaproteobacteria bacterium]|nr:transcriptional regulator [Alphaproteobacteria bacterium]